jgi:aspartate/methionine/tyrosine aminotransferase
MTITGLNSNSQNMSTDSSSHSGVNTDDDNVNTQQHQHQPVQESTIRLMTRLAIQYDALNLSQGFPNEPPPYLLRLKCALAILEGQPDSGFIPSSSSSTSSTTTATTEATEQELQASIINLLSRTKEGIYGDDSNDGGGEHLDQLNQYSPPMGRPDLRASIAQYYQRFYDYDVSPDDITVTLGATEAFASALRATCRPGDKVVIFEPFHELYPSQAKIFYLDPVYVTLRPSSSSPTATTRQWQYDIHELETALKGARALLLNTPHNPTGKVFTKQELKV